jgi:hypothetical protein
MVTAAALAPRFLLAVCVVAALLGLLAVAGRRLAAGGGAPRGRGRLMRIVETTMLPNATALHAIEIGDTCVVVARGPHHVAFVCEVRAETLAAWRGAQALRACPRDPT